MCSKYPIIFLGFFGKIALNSMAQDKRSRSVGLKSDPFGFVEISFRTQETAYTVIKELHSDNFAGLKGVLHDTRNVFLTFGTSM